jgi:hypothetical protein
MAVLSGSPDHSGNSKRKQRSVNPTSQTGTLNSSDLTTLYANIQSGKKIYYADIEKIRTMFNSISGHYHTYQDLMETGDAALGGFSTSDPAYSHASQYLNSVNTAVPGGVSSITWYNTSTVHHLDLNKLATQSRVYKNHTHAITDTITSGDPI